MSARLMTLCFSLFSCLTCLITACPTCPYESQCQGNTLNSCWLGVDQLVGDPGEISLVCQSPNPTCVNLDERNALCVMDEAATCEPDLAPYCSDERAVSCQDGYLVASDCDAHGNGCLFLNGLARCVLEPVVECDPQTLLKYCRNGSLIQCVGGYVSAEVCALRSPPASCVQIESEYGTTAYCD